MNRTIRLLTLALLLIAGVWLVWRGGGPAAEGAARRAALSALAPGRPVGGNGPAGALPDGGQAAPVRVSLGAVPVGGRPENGLYAQWQRGEVDLTETESRLSRAEIAALQAASLRLPPSPALATAQAGARSAPTPGVGWPSLSYLQAGAWVPPDPELAVGDDHVIAVVNSAFAIYDKTGALLGGPYDFATFMGQNANCTNSFAFDPNVIYDEEHDRFVLGIDSDGRYYCLAAADSADPLGDWNVYAFRVGTAQQFFDYPHAAVGDRYIFAGANIFTSSFLEARVYAFDKVAMYAGNTADWVSRPLPATEFTPIPMALHGFEQGTWYTGANHYFITDYNYDGARARVWRWANPLSANPVAVGILNLNSYTGVVAGYPIDAPQQGSTARIQANDWRPHDFEYRDGYAWMTQTIACNPGGGTVNCIRWAKIDPATATIVDGGVYASSGQHRIFPNLAVNRCGDMAVGYTKTGTTLFPGVFVAGRQVGDPPGVLEAETVVQPGTIAYTAFDGSPHRWGDYTGMTIDPDGERFWYLGEYSRNTGTGDGRWGTYVRALTYAGCATGGEGLSLALSAKGNGAVGGVSYQAADIVRYDGDAAAWSMLFDASDVGLSANVQAFARREGGDLLLAFGGSVSLPGAGKIARHDVALFTPTQLGEATAGAFSLYFDGSDVGLSTTGERIDALGVAQDGRLLISTVGSGAVPRPGGGNIKFADEDVLAFTPSQTGATTAGTWALYFDGSTVAGLAVEDVVGLDHPVGGALYVSLGNGFNLGGVRGGAADIVSLTPNGGGYDVALLWEGAAMGFPSLDAFSVE